jgi:uncharacterized membrane protein YedE/YeeE
MIDWISQPWPWYVAGPMIALVMFLLLIFGRQLGVSSSFRTVCAMGGAGKYIPFFSMDWRDQMWNITFIIGIAIGGYLGGNVFSNDNPVDISAETVSDLQELGISNPGHQLVPEEIFSWESLFTPRTMVFLLLGGFLVGFGSRYAGGCTSGHAIMGLSNLQWPSLIAVIGFFIGGLFITHLLMPFLIQL